jgi:acetyl esterase/lipase
MTVHAIRVAGAIATAFTMIVAFPHFAHAQRLDRLNAAMEDDTEPAGTAQVPAGVRVMRNVPYGDAQAQRMDIYLPAAAANAPVILMAHGGGWRHGDKAMRSVVENKVARWVPKGIVFISINYRMLPETAPLQQAEDVARALAFAQRQASAWGGDPARLMLMGHSAGAHLAGLLSASPDMAYQLGAKPWLGSILLDTAALNVEHIMQSRHARLYDRAFGNDPAYWKTASPYHRLSTAAIPALAVCSTRRDIACFEAHRYAEKAKALGVHVQVSEQDLSHRDINLQLGMGGNYTDAVESFMGSLDKRLLQLLK